MIRRLGDVFSGGASIQAADAAVGRGMADVLAALENVIDDDAALRRICARPDENVPSTPLGRGAAGGACARTGAPGPAVTAARASGPAASRRRPALLLAAAVAAVLTAGAVTVAAIGVPGAGRGATKGPAVNAAYVVKRVDSALDAADPAAIAQMTVTTSGAATSGGMTASTTAEEWSYGDRWRAVTYSAAGHLVYDEGFSTASVYTVVSYLARTWAHRRGLGRPAKLAPGPRCQSLVTAPPLLFAPGLPSGGPAAGLLSTTVARDLHAAISCGTLAVAGRQHVDGIEATELTSRPGSMISETIWVSPGTYLPVRVVIRPTPSQPGPRQTADITWLPSAAPNLAKLTVPIPDGFRQVPFAQAVTPLMQHTSAQSPP
jgi:hypothetical protein